jgi:gas vesicle protein
MTKLTLIAILTASTLTTASADMFGGVIKDMMDVPKEIITSTTDAMKDVKDSVKDSVDDVKDSASDTKEETTTTSTAEVADVPVGVSNDVNTTK